MFKMSGIVLPSFIYQNKTACSLSKVITTLCLGDRNTFVSYMYMIHLCMLSQRKYF